MSYHLTAKRWRSVNVRARMRVIIISIRSECQTLGTSWGFGLWAWVERCSQGGNRFSGKGQACVRSAAGHIQPPELWAFILGNKVEFFYLQEWRRWNKSLMLWILHRLGPSVRLNWVAGVQRWGQCAALDKHLYIHMWIQDSFQCAIWKTGSPARDCDPGQAGISGFEKRAVCFSL